VTWVLVLIFGIAAIAAILYKPLWGLALAAATMPLEVAGRLSAANSELTYTKLFLFATVALAVLNAFVTHREWTLPRSAWALGVLWVVAAAASLFSGIGRVTSGIPSLLALAGQIMFVVLLYNFARSTRDIDTVIGAIVVGSIPVAIVGILDVVLRRSALNTVEHQFYGSAAAGSFRITATFYDPNAFGRYIVFALFITLGALALPAFRRFTAPMVALLVAQSFCLANTYSRGGALALVAGLVLYMTWGAPARARKPIIATLLSAVLIGWWLLPPSLGELGARFVDVGSGTDAWGGRFRILQVGVRALGDSPLIGFGPGNVAAAIGRYSSGPEAAHNLYLEIVLATGIIGFALLAVFIAGHIRALLSSASIERYVRLLLVAFCVVLVTGLSLHGFKSNELWLCVALMPPLARLGAGEEAGAG
jgi:putative inorganic carbon (HCO3(-)) transporter